MMKRRGCERWEEKKDDDRDEGQDVEGRDTNERGEIEEDRTGVRRRRLIKVRERQC